MCQEIMERPYEYCRVFLLKTSGLYICSRFEEKKKKISFQTVTSVVLLCEMYKKYNNNTNLCIPYICVQIYVHI